MSLKAGLGAMAALFSAGAAWAVCPISEYQVFTCSFSGGSKTVEICAGSQTAHYSFGRGGQAAELALQTPITALDYRPWNGIGRSIYEEVTFYNAGHGYTVYFAFDRFAEQLEEGASGGISVTKGGRELANLSCDAGSISNGLEQLYQLKLNAGQCWDHSGFAWVTDCPVN